MSNEFLEVFIDRNNLAEEYQQNRPVLLWEEIAGQLANLSQAREMRGNTLIVEVDSSSTKQELSYLESEFRGKINQKLDEQKIDRIKFEVTSLSTSSIRSECSSDLDQVELDEQEKSLIEQPVDDLDLPTGLRERLKRFFAAQKKEEKIRLQQGWKKCPQCGAVYQGNYCEYCSNKLT